MSGKTLTCPNCGKQFSPWRSKKFCSERCRKQEQNRRLEYVRRDENSGQAHGHHEGQNPQFSLQQNQQVMDGVRRYGAYRWVACNEITRKCVEEDHDKALGYAIHVNGIGGVEKPGWYGVIKDERGDYRFGPTSKARAELAVERRLQHAPMEDIREDERQWIGEIYPTPSKPLAAPEKKPSRAMEAA